MRHLPSPDHAKRLTTDELRAAFLLPDLFVPGTIVLHHLDLDRAIVGGAVPTDAPLRLGAPDWLRAESFCERRELGVLNVGGAGTVRSDGHFYAVGPRDVLYVGRGARDVTFASADAAHPARFYLVSFPAHVGRPTMLVTQGEAQATELGDQAHANRRILRKYVHPDGVQSAQLVMGVTELQPGSVWNSIPPHTHARRSEIYLYFDVPADAVVFHLMGEPRETRSLVLHDGEAVLAPGWSIHAGCGTSHYSFCWAMGGENQVFADMDPAPVTTLR